MNKEQKHERASEMLEEHETRTMSNVEEILMVSKSLVEKKNEAATTVKRKYYDKKLQKQSKKIANILVSSENSRKVYEDYIAGLEEQLNKGIE